MTGRERVQRTLTFRSPDRAPRDLWALPAIGMTRRAEYDAMVQRFPLDIGKPYFSPGQSERSQGNFAQVGAYRDDWGSTWEVAETGVVGEVKRPAVADWADLAGYEPPWDLLRTRDLTKVSDACTRSDLFMLSDCTARPFERLQFLRGTENLFLDLAYQPRELYTLRDMVHEFYLEDVRQWCATDVDAVMLMDDWGTQHSLLIDPRQWREFFKPLYRDYCDLIHKAGKYVFFHSDGFIEAIYGDLIEVGVNAINSQLFCMDIDGLAARYQGKVTFWGEIDRQQVLPFGTPAQVRAAVRRVRRALDNGRGGLIAQCEWGKDNPGDNIAAVFDAWAEPG
jgi:hypothetical protein